MHVKALLVMPDFAELPLEEYETAIVPPAANVTAKQIITYGLGAQNTLTLSSRGELGCMLALQRDIVTLQGQRLERQEISLPPLSDPERGLAAVGALLIAGCLPANLHKMMEHVCP